MVRKGEIDDLTGQRPRRRDRDASLPAGELASTYAVELGISTATWFPKLLEAGLVSGQWVPHPTNGTQVLYLTKEDIKAFHERFMTPKMMQFEFGASWQKCIAQLRAAGVKPVALEGQTFGPLYERSFVEQVLGSNDA